MIDQELQNRAERLYKIFKPRLEGSIYTQDTDREVAAFLKDVAAGNYQGHEGQDRKSYSDDQDRKNYVDNQL